MAGRVVVSTLNNDTGVLATQNGMTGIAKAWVLFNGSTSAIRGSFNVSSITKSSTGTYFVNFTTAMTSADYSVAGASCIPGSNYGIVTPYNGSSLPTTTAVPVSALNNTFGVMDATYISVAIFGA